MEFAVLAGEYLHELTFEKGTGLLAGRRLCRSDRSDDLGRCLWPDIGRYEGVL